MTSLQVMSITEWWIVPFWLEAERGWGFCCGWAPYPPRLLLPVQAALGWGRNYQPHWAAHPEGRPLCSHAADRPGSWRHWPCWKEIDFHLTKLTSNCLHRDLVFHWIIVDARYLPQICRCEAGQLLSCGCQSSNIKCVLWICSFPVIQVIFRHFIALHAVVKDWHQ